MKFSISSLAILSFPFIITAAPLASDAGQCTSTSDYCKTAASLYKSCTTGTASSNASTLQACICADIKSTVFGGYFHNLVQCLACLEGFLPGTTNTFPGDAHPHLEIEVAVSNYCDLATPETSDFIKQGKSLTSSTKAAVDLWDLSWIGVQSS